MKEFINPQVARRLCPVVPDPIMKDPGDIVEYVRKQKVTKIGDGEDDYLVGEEIVESSRVNRQAYIMKDADQVGVLNILEKVRRSGDITLFNQTHLAIPEGEQDYTNVPSSVGEALNALKSGADSFAGLKAIFGNVTFDELANMSAADIQSALDKYVASIQSSKEGETK